MWPFLDSCILKIVKEIPQVIRDVMIKLAIFMLFTYIFAISFIERKLGAKPKRTITRAFEVEEKPKEEDDESEQST